MYFKLDGRKVRAVIRSCTCGGERRRTRTVPITIYVCARCKDKPWQEAAASGEQNSAEAGSARGPTSSIVSRRRVSRARAHPWQRKTPQKGERKGAKPPRLRGGAVLPTRFWGDGSRRKAAGPPMPPKRGAIPTVPTWSARTPRTRKGKGEGSQLGEPLRSKWLGRDR